jgi:hypothetical protein
MVGTESGRTRRALTAAAGPRLDWREGPDGMLNAARGGWEARIRRNATGEYELTTYRAASKPTQVPGAPQRLPFWPIASFTRHRLLGRAKAVAEAYLQRRVPAADSDSSSEHGSTFEEAGGMALRADQAP